MKFLQKNWLLSALLAVLVFGGAGYYFSQNKINPVKTPTTQNSGETKKVVATVDINDGVKTTHYDITDGIGKSALEVTQTATGGNVVTKGEGVLAFVTTINGRVASSDKKEFWEFDVNGKQAEVGAGSYSLKEGDKILWKIATY